jgi:hypothetical protein
VRRYTTIRNDLLMEDLDDVRTEILSTATEDLNGVWEAWWTVNRLRPELPLSSRLALAEEALRSLLAQDLVRLSRGSWDAQVDVPSADVNDVLRDYETWVASADRELVFFTATRRGFEAYGLPVPEDT